MIPCLRLLKRGGAAPRLAYFAPRVEQLEVREVLSGYAPTGVEQEFLERLNDARANPAAYGASIGLNLSGVAPSQPLAFNPSLIQSSRDHSWDMNVHNFFDHTGSDGSSPFQRMTADGYAWTAAAESIAAGYATPESALAGLIIDAGVPDLGHRDQLLSIGSPYNAEQETGVGIVLGGTGAYQNYYTIDSGATADTRPILTGVAYNDLNHDGLYENGEGLGGVVITATGPGGTYQTVTWGSGGYSLRVAPGTYTVIASGGGLAAPVSRVAAVGAANYRLNFTPPTGITTTALTASPNPSRVGQAVTLTATVTSGSVAGVPTGTVEFFDGTTDLGPGSALSGSGTRATSVLVTSALSAGTHTLKAVYSPTGVFLGSQGTLTQAVRADHLTFSTQPTDTVAGVAIAPAVQVWLVDAAGNLQTGDNNDQVTLAVASGPAAFAAGSTTTVTVQGGVATFDHLILTAAGSYTLGASAPGVAGPSSAAFVVSPAAADHLAFAVQPSPVVVGQTISPAVQVQVRDHFGNLITTDNSDQVTLGVATGPGGFTAGSTTTAAVSGGVATFDNLALTASGSYTLAATDTGGLAGATSAAFTVALFADDFNRPDSTDLGPSWTLLTGAAGVQGNRLAVGGSAPALAAYNSAALADVGVQATIALPATGTQSVGLMARYAGPSVYNFYRGQITSNNGVYTAILYRRLGGGLTQLGPAVTVSTGTGTLRLEVVGNSLKLFLNGRLLTHAFDSALTTGAAGAWGTPGATLDNFEADTINRVSAALPFRDGFAQATGSQLSRSWTEQAGNFQALGNGQLRAIDPGLSLATLNLAPAAADVALQANVALAATGAVSAGLMARYSGSGDGNMYLGVVTGSNGSFAASIYRHVGATWTLLSSRALTGGTGLLRFVVKGSRLQLSWNGVLVCDVSDGAIATAGLVGLRASQGALYSNFSAAAS
jgi:uncharacterized protein YkwD